MKAIRIHAYGGPEVLKLEEVGEPEPPAGHVLVEVAAAGINFIDVYQRTGLYPIELPATLGLEAAGVVVALGDGVEGFAVGDRVASARVSGGYAERTLVRADQAVRIPDGIDARSAAAAMLQGMTAHYLVFSTFALKPDHTCLIHAAAGGVGLLLIQMAKRCGARVLGTVSTDDKARLASKAGADQVFVYSRQDFEAEVKKATDGRGVDVVYDSVGQATFDKSLDCLADLGMLVLYGQSSGPVPPFDPARLARGGSLFLTRPSLFQYIAERDDLERRASDVLGWVADGSLELRIGRTDPLAEAVAAHRALEGRETSGKVLLIP